MTGSTNSNSTNSSHPTPSPTPDPYAGWKTYTDSQHHYSFEYPATGWAIDTSSSEQVTLLPADKNVEVDYLYTDPHPNGPVSFTANSVDNMHDTTQTLKVVGGLYGGVTAQYSVVDASLLNTYPLTIGQSSQFPAYPHFTDTHVAGGTTIGTFRAKSTISGAQTNAWFSTDDAKTSLLILESLTY